MTRPITESGALTPAAMLAAYDSFISGSPITPDEERMARHIARAASFGAEAYEQGYEEANATHAMLRAFLMALIDPAHPDLDYLRADPAFGAVARATPTEDRSDE